MFDQLEGFLTTASDYSARAGSVGGKLTVSCLNSTLSEAQSISDFAFLVYKSSPSLGPSEAPKHRYSDDIEWSKKQTKEFKAWIEKHRDLDTPDRSLALESATGPS